jgi:hypothetical protein
MKARQEPSGRPFANFMAVPRENLLREKQRIGTRFARFDFGTAEAVP